MALGSVCWQKVVTGVDVHGLDGTRADKRAVFDAFPSQQKAGISAARGQDG